MINAYPLQWPIDRPRTSDWARKVGPNQMPEGRVRQLLLYELGKMNVDNIVVSTNVATRRDGLPYAGQRAPEDPGVVLYFTRKGQDIAISCDRWASVNANLRAIGLTVEAIRGMERWGTEEMIDRAFTGFAALPETASAGKAEWWSTLGLDGPTKVEAVIKDAYKRAAVKTHPDRGGSNEAFQAVQEAFKQGISQL